MINNERYLQLFENCIPIRGAKHCVIQDNARGKVLRIPDLLFDFIIDSENKKMYSLQKEVRYRDDIFDFTSYLISEEYAFLTDDPNRFPAISTHYESSEFINNVILDYSQIYEHKTNDIISDLTALGCKHLQIRFFNDFSLEYINKILSDCTESRLLSISIIMNYNKKITFEMANNLMEEYPYLKQFYVYSVPDEYIRYAIEGGVKFHSGVLFSAHKIISEKSCGKIGEQTFSISTNSYLLSKNYNNCLYKKIAIDSNGEIKNCPSSPISLGNILNDSILEIFQHKPETKLYWEISKDKIDVCNICEYRYACTDCRAYIENPDDMYSKPLKCGYNPYTGVWEEWSTNPLKQKAIDYYGMREVLPEFKMKPDYVPNTPSDPT